MPMEGIDGVFWQVVTSVVMAAVTGVAGYVGGKYKEARARREREDMRIDQLCDGMRSVLRSNLVTAYDRHVTCGVPLSIEDYENLEKSYQAYHGLEGNGVGTKMWDAIKKVPITGAIGEGEQ